MNSILPYGFVVFLLAGVISGISFADQPPSIIVQITGGESTIADDTDGTAIITIKDIDSTVNLSDGDKSSEKSLDFLTVLQYPMNAALELSTAENKSVSMVIIANTTISDDNKTVTLRVTPLPFYEGGALSEFATKSVTLDELSDTTFTGTGIQGEITMEPMNNSVNDMESSFCHICMRYCMIRDTRWECNKQCAVECS